MSELPKTVHLLLSPECLHNVICVAKSNTTNNAPGEEGSNCVNSESNTDTRGNQQLSNQWVPFLSFNDLNSPPPMIFVLWNGRGIKNQTFAMHFKELLNYHKPALVVLTKTKCGGDEADEIVAKFQYPHSIKVDSQGALGGIYIIWNDQVSVQPVAITQQEIYLFIKVHNSYFYHSVVYARPYTEFKHALSHNFRAFNHIYKGHWLTFGDYKEITNDSEKFGGKKQTRKECMILIIY